VLRGTTKVIKERQKVDIKTVLKTSVATGALMALAAPVTFAPVSSADAAGLSNANSKFTTTLGGRVHRAIMHADDGKNDGLFNTDGQSGNSEVWLTGSGALTESITVGGKLRWDIGKNQGNCNFGSTTGEDTCASVANTHKNESIYFKHKSMGTLTIGDQAEAGAGAPNLDYASKLNDVGATSGGFNFTTSSSGSFSTITAGAVFDDTDPGTQNAIRYDSPSFGGMGLALSFAQGGSVSSKLSYAGTLSGLSVKAAIGHTNAEGAGDDVTTSGGIAVKHASGLNARVAYGKTQTGNSEIDAQYQAFGLGYAGKFNSLGQTDIYAVVHETEDSRVDNDDADEITVGIKQALDSIGGAMGLSYTQVSYDDGAGTDYNDIDVIYFETSFNF